MSEHAETEAVLYRIMRLASYLPRHSPERKAIEDAASALIRGDQFDGRDDA